MNRHLIDTAYARGVSNGAYTDPDPEKAQYRKIKLRLERKYQKNRLFKLLKQRRGRDDNMDTIELIEETIAELEGEMQVRGMEIKRTDFEQWEGG